MTLTTMLYEKRYFDDSGPELQVGMKDGRLLFSYQGSVVTLPSCDLDWIINSLRMVRYQLELEREERGEKK